MVYVAVSAGGEGFFPAVLKRPGGSTEKVAPTWDIPKN